LTLTARACASDKLRRQTSAVPIAERQTLIGWREGDAAVLSIKSSQPMRVQRRAGTCRFRWTAFIHCSCRQCRKWVVGRASDRMVLKTPEIDRLVAELPEIQGGAVDFRL